MIHDDGDVRPVEREGMITRHDNANNQYTLNDNDGTRLEDIPPRANGPPLTLTDRAGKYEDEVSELLATGKSSIRPLNL